MTSLALSPHLCGAKRGRRSPESDLYCGSKRARGFQACGSSRPYLRERSALQQILSVLPGMDETVISNVLDQCNGDLNEALEKLTELSLTSNSSEQCGSTPQAAASSPRPSQPPAPDAQPAAGFSGRPSAAADGEETERWAAALTHEVTSARDQQDLQQRAYQFLTLCKSHIETREAEKAGTRMAELAQQNSVLKKAVAIQHQRMVKTAAEKECQVQGLRSALSQCQERNASLEAANYALNVHLKQATAGQSLLGGRPPDVF